MAEEFIAIGYGEDANAPCNDRVKELVKDTVNVEEYISSGILEAYALGELSEQERAAVERNLLQYPQLRKELDLIEEAQEQLLMRAGVQPKASVKTRLFASIDNENQRQKLWSLDATALMRRLEVCSSGGSYYCLGKLLPCV